MIKFMYNDLWKKKNSHTKSWLQSPAVQGERNMEIIKQ